MRRVLVIALLFPLSYCIGAQEDQWQLVGQAQLKVLFWPVYDSSLLSMDGKYREGQRPLRLEIHYLRDVEAADLLANTQSEWEGLPAVPAVSSQWLQQLSQIWPDVSEDDVLAIEVDEQGSSQFFVNGSALGGIDDPAFGKHFLAIWLSPQTSRPELRQALIGDQ